ncbi:MAG: zinc ABC transporter substrate-binding protein, partial [Mobilitalea sp.]
MKNVMRNVVVTIMILSTVYLVGCSSEVKEKVAEEKPIIAVSIVPEQTFVEAVCGDFVDIVTLVPSGSSPENYEPTAQEMEKFSDASLYFSIGVPTEEANILPNVGDVKVISLQDEVASIYEDRTFESGERDPHIWLSPKRVKVMV